MSRDDVVRELVEQALADFMIVGGPSASVVRLFLERAYDAGAAQERAAVVAWLRDEQYSVSANYIEAGEHIPKEEKA